MNWSLPFVPPQGSAVARSVDMLFLFELLVSALSVLLIVTLVVYFAIRYRRRSDEEVPPYTPTHRGLELTWTLGTFFILLIYFFWGAKVYVHAKRPPENATQIYVVGKQWMWKIEHTDGIREINELHVPLGQTVQLIMTSQDVIHDFSIPAFRIKQDVLPGSYVTEWFRPTRIGTYHLFCSQYCGTDHAKMVGRVIVMEPAQYAAWHAGVVPDDPPAAAGQRLFQSYGCASCHGERAPTMAGLYMSHVMLQDGTTVLADDQYLRESLLNATAKIVAGYPPVMPSFRGQLSEQQIMQLLAYIKSLQAVKAAEPGPAMVGPSTMPAAGYSPQQVHDFPPARQPPSIELPPRSR